MVLDFLKKRAFFRDELLAAGSAVLLVFSQPRHDLGFLAWFALVPFFIALQQKTAGRSLRLGYLFGMFYFFGMFWWLVHVTLPGMVLFNLYLALYPAGFAVLYTVWRRKFKPGVLQIILTAASWTALEFLRAELFSGFGWASLGHSQYRFLPILQIADVTGVFGISFVLVVVNMALFYGSQREGADQPQALWPSFVFSAVLLVGVLAYGFFALSKNAFLPDEPRSLKVTVVQPNVLQSEKWAPSNWDEIMEKLERLSRQGVGRSTDVDLIVWPETSLPGYRWESPQYFERVKVLAKDLKTPILLGAESHIGKRFFNSAILISGQGEEAARYDKIHLVPFGEFIPLRPWLNFIGNFVPMEDLSPGADKTVFVLGNPKVGVSALICFEDTVRDVSRGMVQSGGQVLINLTNDAWFLRTKAPFLHLQMSVFEAVGNRRAMIRAANTGVSGIIHPSGRVVGVIKGSSGEETFIAGHLNARVPVAGNRQAIFTRYGDFFAYFCFVCLGFGVIININTKKQKFKKENS